MLQLFHLNVAKVDRGMSHMLHVLQVFSKACCKRLFKMFHLFPDVGCNRFLSRCCICCNSIFSNVSVVSSYVATSGLMLQVVSILFWMFHVFDTHVAK
jgi:hypothetical protein